MRNHIITRLLPTLSVPLGIALVLIPFSLLIGWSIGTIALFWFIITPALALYLPTLTSKRKSTLVESIAGTLLSYGLMVFMIYDHYRSDMFLMIMISCGFNLIVMYVMFIVRKTIHRSCLHTQI